MIRINTSISIFLLLTSLICKAQQPVELQNSSIALHREEFSATLYSEKELDCTKSKCYVNGKNIDFKLSPTVNQSDLDDPYTTGYYEYKVEIDGLPIGQDIILRFEYIFADEGSIFVDTLQLPFKKRTARLLSVGTGNNPDPFSIEPELNWAQQQADSVLIAFKKYGDNYYIFNLATLLNDDSATKEHILKSFESIEKDLDSCPQEDRVVLLYLNGHGRFQKNNRGEDEFLFVCKDTLNIDRDIISASEINDHLLKMVGKGAIVWVFVDACYSALIYGDLRRNDFIDKSGAIYFFTSSKFNNRNNTVGVAVEDKKRGSVFTVAMLESITEILEKNTDVTAMNLSDAIITKLKNENIEINKVAPFGTIPGEDVLFFVSGKQNLNESPFKLNLCAGFWGVYNPIGIRVGLNYRFLEGYLEVASGSARTFELESYEMPFRMNFSYGLGIGAKLKNIELSIGARLGRMTSNPLTLVYDWNGNVIPQSEVRFIPEEKIHSIETITYSTPFAAFHPAITFYPLSRIEFWKNVFVSCGYNFYFNISDGVFRKIDNIRPLHSWSIMTGYSIFL